MRGQRKDKELIYTAVSLEAAGLSAAAECMMGIDKLSGLMQHSRLNDLQQSGCHSDCTSS